MSILTDILSSNAGKILDPTMSIANTARKQGVGPALKQSALTGFTVADPGSAVGTYAANMLRRDPYKFLDYSAYGAGDFISPRYTKEDNAGWTDVINGLRNRGSGGNTVYDTLGPIMASYWGGQLLGGVGAAQGVGEGGQVGGGMSSAINESGGVGGGVYSGVGMGSNTTGGMTMAAEAGKGSFLTEFLKSMFTDPNKQNLLAQIGASTGGVGEALGNSAQQYNQSVATQQAVAKQNAATAAQMELIRQILGGQGTELGQTTTPQAGSTSALSGKSELTTPTAQLSPAPVQVPTGATLPTESESGDLTKFRGLFSQLFPLSLARWS